MRTDAEGSLYVTRNGNAKVVVVSHAGRLLQEYPLSTIDDTTNLAFGGTDGRAIYVVGRCGQASWGTCDGYIEAVPTSGFGREWAWLRDVEQKAEPGSESTLEPRPGTKPEPTSAPAAKQTSEPETTPETTSEPGSSPVSGSQSLCKYTACVSCIGTLIWALSWQQLLWHNVS